VARFSLAHMSGFNGIANVLVKQMLDKKVFLLKVAST